MWDAAPACNCCRSELRSRARGLCRLSPCPSRPSPACFEEDGDVWVPVASLSFFHSISLCKGNLVYTYNVGGALCRVCVCVCARARKRQTDKDLFPSVPSICLTLPLSNPQTIHTSPASGCAPGTYVPAAEHCPSHRACLFPFRSAPGSQTPCR